MLYAKKAAICLGLNVLISHLWYLKGNKFYFVLISAAFWYVREIRTFCKICLFFNSIVWNEFNVEKYESNYLLYTIGPFSWILF